MFDAIIVIISIGEEITVASFELEVEVNVSVMRAFRVLRVFRVFKLAKSWVVLRQLIQTVLASAAGMVNFMVILGLFIFIFALAGMSLFGGRFHECSKDCVGLSCNPDCYGLFPDGSPRSNFDSFANSLLSVFQVMISENWHAVMYDCMKLQPTSLLWYCGTAFFFILMFFIGHFIVLALFVAILQEQFQDTEKHSSLMWFFHKAYGTAKRVEEEEIEPHSMLRKAVNIIRGRFKNQGKAVDDQNTDQETSELEMGTTARSRSASRTGRQCRVVATAANTNTAVTRAARSNLLQSLPYLMRRSITRRPPAAPATSIHQRELAALTQVLLEQMGSRSVRIGCRIQHGVVSGKDLVKFVIDNCLATCVADAMELLDNLLRGGYLVFVADDCALREGIVGVRREDREECRRFRSNDSLFRIVAPSNTSYGGEQWAGTIGSDRDGIRGPRVSVVDLFTTEELHRHDVSGKTLFFFGPTSHVRNVCLHIVQHPWFGIVMFVLIAFGSVLDALNDAQVVPGSTKDLVFWYCDLVLTILFTLEMFVKIIATGFYYSSGSYWSQPLNRLDLLVVVFSILGLAVGKPSTPAAGASRVGWVKSIRVLRALRPLRVINRNRAMQHVVNAIMVAIPAVANIFLLLLLFIFIFGIIGVQLFQGRMNYCHDPRNPDWDNVRYVYNKTKCLSAVNVTEGHIVHQLAWGAPQFSFDNILLAMLTNFEIAMVEMWPRVLLLAVDVAPGSSGVDHPVMNSSLTNSLYFVAFILVCSIFIMSLFLGVLVFKFSKEREKESQGSLFLSPGQKQWMRTRNMILTSAPDFVATVPRNSGWIQRIRLSAYNLVKPDTHVGRQFELFILVLIMLNTVCISLNHYGQTDAFVDMLHSANSVFLVMFSLEAVVKLAGLGIRQYFRVSKWNTFDFLIVVASLTFLGYEKVSDSKDGTVVDITILRVLRTARVVRLVKMSRGLQSVCEVVVMSLVPLINIGSLLLLVFFVYAVMGMNMYGQETAHGYYINEQYNFETFGRAMLLLFRSSTGENWNGFMHELGQQHPLSAYAFFISFTLVCSFVLLNLFIAVIMDSFYTLMRADASSVAPSLLHVFGHKWGELSCKGSLTMPSYKLFSLLMSMEYPLGIIGHPDASQFHLPDPLQSQQNLAELITGMQIHRSTKDRAVFYPDVLTAVVAAKYRCSIDDPDLERKLTKRLQARAQRQYGNVLEYMQSIDMEICDLTEDLSAAVGIQKIWRAYRVRLALVQQLYPADKLTPSLMQTLPAVARFGSQKGFNPGVANIIRRSLMERVFDILSPSSWKVPEQHKRSVLPSSYVHQRTPLPNGRKLLPPLKQHAPFLHGLQRVHASKTWMRVFGTLRASNRIHAITHNSNSDSNNNSNNNKKNGDEIAT